MKNQPNKAAVKDAAKREQTGYFLKQQPILDGDIVAQHCEMVDDYSGKVSTQLNRLLVCWNGKDWDVKCLDSMVGYRNQYWGSIPAFHEVVGNAVDNPEMIPSEVEWTRKDSEPVKEGLPTAEQIIRTKIKEHSDSTVRIDVDNIPAFTHFLFVAIEAMQSYSDQQNAELRECHMETIKVMADKYIDLERKFVRSERLLSNALERVKELDGALAEIQDKSTDENSQLTAWKALQK